MRLRIPATRRGRIRFACFLLVIAAAIYSQLPSSSPAQQVKLHDRLLFAPSRYPDGDWKPAGLRFEDVYFEATDGTKLHGWFCSHPRAKGLIFHAHGNGGHLADRAGLVSLFQDVYPAHVFLFDYRGYGRSEGRATVEGAILDTDAALEAALEKAKMPLEQTIFWGRSLGGAMIIELSKKHEPSVIVVESSFASLRAVGQKRFPGLALLVPRNTLDSVATIKSYKSPLFVSHGDADRVIPFEHGRQLFDDSGSPPDKKVFLRLPGAGHNGGMPMAYYKQVGAFLTKHVPAKR
jgi:fermentation-respiration switch protein FrsA (DUF1100 family)